MQRSRTLSVVLAVLCVSTLAFARAEGTFDRTLNVNAGQVDLEVSTGSGDIKITPGSGNIIQLHAHISIGERMFGNDDAQQKLQRIISNPPIEQDGNTIRIGKIHDTELRRNVSISYDISVPANTRLRSETGSGNQTAEGINGPVNSSTGSGDITLTRVGGEVHANTGSGNIRAREIDGAFIANTGSGDINLHQSAPGRVDVQTGSGNAVLENVKGSVRAGTGSGDITASGETAGTWELHTGSGNVTLNLPQQANFQLLARTSSGDIHVDHPVTMQGSLNRHEVRGTVGSGGSLVDIRTGSGDIRVH